MRLPILVASLFLLVMACPGCAQQQVSTPPPPPTQTETPPATGESTQDPRPEVARQQDPQRQGQRRQDPQRQGQQGQGQQGQGQQGQQGQGQQTQGQQDPQQAGGNESRRRRWGRGGQGAEGAEGENQSRGGRRRGGFGRFGRGRGPGDGEEAGADGEGEAGQDGEEKKPEKARPGIAIHDMMVEMHCVRCHPQNDEGMMTRISYVRMSPEGWSQTLKRMIRLHGLQISPSEAKQVVRYLADNNGLTRSEAERSHYESERRVHWSEEHHDEDLRRTCSACHPLGRVFSQARDPEEWQLLRTTHVAMFPGASRQMGGGPPRESSSSRFGGFGGFSGAGNWSGGSGGDSSSSSSSGGRGERGGRGGSSSSRDRSSSSSSQRRGSRGDGVIDKLAETQPLFTPEWETWVNNRREIPAQGRWTLKGHQLGLGDFVGHVDLVRTDANEYDTVWTFAFGDDKPIVRRGKGILYAGYSWRGRATDEQDADSSWREVLLMDERWDRMTGRVFQGNHDEVGMDVVLTRHRGMPRVHAVAAPWVTVPAEGHVLEVLGENFPANIAATDFRLGKGITVTACERIDENRVHLTLDVAPDTECGKRQIIYGLEPALCEVQLFDAVDYVRIRPLQGLARIGGIQYPKQFERFEAVAVYRGKDGKNYTDDDVDLWMVEGADWQLKESPVRHSDNDLAFVGKLDPKTAVFTPGVDGPNPARKFSGNNTGEVLVECEVELNVPQRPEPEEPAAADLAEGEAGEGGEETDGSATAAASEESGTGNNRKPKVVPEEPVAAEASLEDEGTPPTSGKPHMANKKFRARAHMIVTVPLYVRWTKLDWKEEQ